jgi:hypothetical protein
VLLYRQERRYQAFDSTVGSIENSDSISDDTML